jgi:hypothetical protein
MRVRRFIPALLLVCAQLLAGAQSTEIPVPTAAYAQHYLDSLQPYTPLSLHAYCQAVDIDSTQASITQSDAYRLYTWEVKQTGVAIQVKLETTRFNWEDSIKLYNGDRLIQYFTQANLWQKQTVSIASHERLTLVLKKSRNSTAELRIRELIVSPENLLHKTADFGDAQSCQVNANCSEGIPYNNIVRSVVRIAVRLGSAEGWCTGTLMNNTANTFAPLILSAEHCGLIGTQFASQQDLNAWRFYFNYESPDCNNPASEGLLASQLIGGATLLCRSDDEGGETGSDLLLLRLSIDVPEAFNAYYAGWNRSENTTPANGVSIHHPEGDIKKISFMQGSAANTSFGNITPNTHWLTRWKSSLNGHGTTEPGSSGAALFDQNNLVVGQLTGGNSSCFNVQDPDFYGKFSYNWTSNGSTPNRQLRPWLDPANTGLIALPGANLNDAVNADTLSFSLSPNPSKGIFYLRGLGSLTKSIQIEVFALNGKLLYQQETLGLPNAPVEVDLRHLRNGLYFFKIVQGEQIFHSSVLVEN